MKLKTIDKVFDWSLWVIFILLVVCSWGVATALEAPSFEVVNTDVKFPYEYTTKDGNRVKSFYKLAWYHEQFSTPKIVAYDPNSGLCQTIKDEYIEEYKAMMPKSQYSFWNRCFWLLFAVFVVVSALLSYYVGGFIRDMVLYRITIRRNTFTDCAYFLYHNRRCFKKQVRQNIGKTIDNYITTQSHLLYKKYVPSFADLVIDLLTEIKQQQDTRVRFYYTYLDNTKKQVDYLKELSLFWHSQIGKNDKAEQFLEDINILRQKDYVDFSLTASGSDFVGIVSDELKKLFSDVMGGEVFNFYACKADFAAVTKMPGAIFVTTTIENSLSTFSWAGGGYSKQSFPGLSVLFTIYHYQDGKKIILWNKYLTPKCTYKAEADSLDIDDLYKNMITETIRSFPESLKK